MGYINVKIHKKIATIVIDREKVNALNDQVVKELRSELEKLEKDQNVRVIILIGEGSFFSFGFDVPGFMSYDKGDFHGYVQNYNNLIKELFMFSKPVIAALNGHSIAGGCVLALACDYRIMISGKSKIALNEMTFGSTLFSSVTEILKYAVGSKTSEQIIYSGKLYSADEALNLGLVDQVCSEDIFDQEVLNFAEEYAAKDIAAFASIKKMLKQDTLNKIESYEDKSISEFVEIWYSQSTREQLTKIEIR